MRATNWIKPFDPALHRPGTQATKNPPRCSWIEHDALPVFSVAVTEVGAAPDDKPTMQSVCLSCKDRVIEVYGPVKQSQ